MNASFKTGPESEELTSEENRSILLIVLGEDILSIILIGRDDVSFLGSQRFQGLHPENEYFWLGEWRRRMAHEAHFVFCTVDGRKLTTYSCSSSVS